MTGTEGERLAAQVLHLWCLPRSRERRARLCETGFSFLSEDERERHAAITSSNRARSFLLGRVLLRQALGRHLGCGPGDLRFGESDNGKLSLISPADSACDFSLTHSRTDLLVAVARARAVGADIEEKGRAAQVLKIAQRVFPQAEKLQFEGREEWSAAETALSLWVLKESVTKAVGGTIWPSVGQVVLTLEGGGLAWLAPPPQGERADWTLLLGAFRQDHRFAAALWQPGSHAKDWRCELHLLGEGDMDSRELQITAAAGA